jgi:MFS family permease
MGKASKFKYLKIGLYGALIGSLLAGFLVQVSLHPKHHFSWEAFPLFSALYGFIGCIIIILGSKALGHHWLQKKEDYYENSGKRESEHR